jgi:hypothetical protein
MPLRWATPILLAAALALSSCLPGHRGKSLVVKSECTQPAWLRVSEEARATASTFENQPADRLEAGGTFRSNVFDNDVDGISMAIAGSESDVGKIIAVPHSEGDTVEVVISGERCP